MTSASLMRNISNSACLATEVPSSRLPQQTATASNPTADPFHESLQSKTEQELMAIIMKNKLSASAGPVKESEEDEEEELADINDETGEVHGYRGKEPTRFGDWEHKGRCTDFE
ncbi:hypothetical protein CEUSTIGMA_g9306.t1 [Chlamydomonas eustigma]|uniref:Succinate dehydrogenase assembly factor 4, mitochondrial n=1 Tax=Chlamydomonas eustigma TaxID=1157962 RepID=A0A250XFM0_9CHLO|nr:hypothetical protein CEUSTIGMA_g9306.t1 [Chlamydomonas eustigma]|eukprot:GAX81878.1 hypothetical protein CEUSTIGMA_g9306.t1 [Chlamydomonas eustigma]